MLVGVPDQITTCHASVLTFPLLGLSVLVACSPPAKPATRAVPRENGCVGWSEACVEPPMPATPGDPLLTLADPLATPGHPEVTRPPAFPANVHYLPVRRYQIGAVVYPRISVSPDGKGIAIAPDAPDQVIVLYDIDDPTSERVVHLGKPENNASPWRGYRAYDVAWCGGDRPTIYVAAGHAMWALDARTLVTLPGWPIARRAWRATCLHDHAVAVSEGIYGPEGTGAVTVFERNGTQRFSTWVYQYPPHDLAITQTGLILAESGHGIVLLDPKTGVVVHDVRLLGPKLPLRTDSRLHGMTGILAASPTAPEIVLAVENYRIGSRDEGGLWEHLALEPLWARIPEFAFTEFPDIAELPAIDNSTWDAIDKHTDPKLFPSSSRGFHLAPFDLRAMAYSPDGRDIAIAGTEKTTGSWNNNVVWVLRDGKLFDTLVGHPGTSQDVKVLSDGRIVSVSSAGIAEIFVWAPREAPGNAAAEGDGGPAAR